MIDLEQLVAAMQANRAQSQQTFPPVVGRAPPQQPLPVPTAGNHMFQPGSYGAQAQGLLGGQPGSYGSQAAQLAGLLGNQNIPRPVMGAPFTPGRFMPGFRPGIDQPITHTIGGAQRRGPVQQY